MTRPPHVHHEKTVHPPFMFWKKMALQSCMVAGFMVACCGMVQGLVVPKRGAITTYQPSPIRSVHPGSSPSALCSSNICRELPGSRWALTDATLRREPVFISMEADRVERIDLVADLLEGRREPQLDRRTGVPVLAAALSSGTRVLLGSATVVKGLSWM